MPKHEPFTCPHPDLALRVYVATFSGTQVVKLCQTCADKINRDPLDRRGVGWTKREACAFRDPKLTGL